jgi:hypothetical protein
MVYAAARLGHIAGTRWAYVDMERLRKAKQTEAEIGIV